MEKIPTLLTVVALALIDSAGQVLMQQRPAHRTHGGLWEFPGGKVEQGEGPCVALVREIEEELGISVATADFTPVSFATMEASAGMRPMVLLLYACHCWEGTPACEPGAALRWAVPADLDALPMPPLDVPLAAALRCHLEKRVK